MALLIAACLVVASGSGWAEAAPNAKAAARSDSKSSGNKRSKKKSSDKGTKKECSRVNGKKKCKRVAMFQGHNASRAKLRTEPLAKPSGDVWLRAENLAQEVRVNIYKDDGSLNEGSLAQLDELFRCKQTGEVRAVRSELYEQLSRIYDHFGGKRVDLVSGFRFAERSSSRHFHASAMDIRITGVSIRDMYAYAESLDGGNMGIGLYPTSGFIHVDFRAQGEPSYRWTDRSGPNSGKKSKKSKKKSTNRTQPARKPVS
ncbi:MAG: YcbK family protein [Deltaproteobacteria bacterium]|nr:YcbK family protein [Deltaproteobacteria bacterium]